MPFETKRSKNYNFKKKKRTKSGAIKIKAIWNEPSNVN